MQFFKWFVFAMVTLTLYYISIYIDPLHALLLRILMLRDACIAVDSLKKNKFLQRSKLTYAQKMQNAALSKCSTNASRDKLLLTVKQRNQE